MANRYWVGGTGTWDNLALLKWSTTSGGLGGQAVPTSADTVFFDANSGANTVTIGAGTAICSTLTMTSFTGTLAFGSNSIDLAGTGTIYTGATTFSVSGTPLMLVTNTSSTNRTVNAGNTTEANSISFNINAGSALFSTTATTAYKNITFSGTFTGSFNNGTRTIYGNLTYKTGMTQTAGTNTTTFAATSGTQTITSAALNLDFPITFSGTATYQLIDDLTVGTSTTRRITLTSGTLDLNNKIITNFGEFVSANTNTRSILFGTTGKYENTNTGTVTAWSAATITGFSYTGTPTVNLSGNAASGVTRTIQHGSTAGGTEANAVSFNITAGSDTISLTTNTIVEDLTFSGTFTGNLTNSARTIYGNLTFKSGMALNVGGNTTTLGATSGTQLLTSAALTLDFPISMNGVGGTTQLVDALIMGSTRQLTLVGGTFNSNSKNVTCGNFSYTGGGTKAFNLGTSVITIQGGSNTTGWVGTNSGTTYTSVTSSTIVFTTTGTAAFSGGQGTVLGNQFGTLRLAGVGGTLFLGTNGNPTVARCVTLENTVSPCTFTNSCTTAFTVDNFNVSGTAGNLVTFNSNVAGTAKIISKASGTVNAYYLNIQDSTASGGAVWYANSSINGTNNTGWNVFNNSFLMVF
jgi:hypothetical protein